MNKVSNYTDVLAKLNRELNVKENFHYNYRLSFIY